MTEMDRLRELLDEAGVDYLNRSSDITIGYYTDPHTVIEAMDGTLQMTGLTAEQVVRAMGQGTCRLERADWDDGTCTWGCVCSACDAHLEHETGIGYNFCPICGAKVVDA